MAGREVLALLDMPSLRLLCTEFARDAGLIRLSRKHAAASQLRALLRDIVEQMLFYTFEEMLEYGLILIDHEFQDRYTKSQRSGRGEPFESLDPLRCRRHKNTGTWLGDPLAPHISTFKMAYRVRLRPNVYALV